MQFLLPAFKQAHWKGAPEAVIRFTPTGTEQTWTTATDAVRRGMDDLRKVVGAD